ncbi:hypothetical protein ACFVZD_47405 [Streptomyces sp. NPDC058287]|uniref:hypothetical protein n=1 Tax=Streptomyces sp. NPDC058287 TaxID=3346423 RepID=UPI0036E9B1DD
MKPAGRPWWGEDITSLSFDYGTHDSLLSLWAVSSQGSRRQHVLDVPALKAAQWRELALGITALTGGRLSIDITRLDHPGAPRDS